MEARVGSPNNILYNHWQCRYKQNEKGGQERGTEEGRMWLWPSARVASKEKRGMALRTASRAPIVDHSRGHCSMPQATSRSGRRRVKSSSSPVDPMPRRSNKGPRATMNAAVIIAAAARGAWRSQVTALVRVPLDCESFKWT
jgi:hypothetical protein